jgi:formamidopyrimidine-DNA glycosylase
MPELPEVETNARNLRRWAEGRRIVRVAPPAGTRETGGVPPTTFVRRLRGRQIETVERRGKWILCRLSEGGGLALHLGMTAKVARVPEGAATPRFTRATLSLDDGARVCFVDMRRFGRLLTAPYADLVARPAIAGIGPDALSSLDRRTLAAAFARTRRSVKETLLDQRVAGGIGNLYATEALWRARIHPATPAPALDGAALGRLLTAIRAALQHGLAQLDGEETPEYLEDGAPNPFHCYDRAGHPCHRCGALLESMVLGGRTSAFCPRCQTSLRRGR